MYSFLPEYLLDAFFLLSDFAGDLVIDFDVTGWAKVDSLIGVIGVVWSECMGGFYLCVWDLGIGLLPDVIVLLELVLRGDLLGGGGLLVFTLFEEILIHVINKFYLKFFK